MHGIKKMASVIKNKEKFKFKFYAILRKIKEKWERMTYSFILTFHEKKKSCTLYFSLYWHLYLSCCMYSIWVKAFLLIKPGSAWWYTVGDEFEVQIGGSEMMRDWPDREFYGFTIAQSDTTHVHLAQLFWAKSVHFIKRTLLNLFCYTNAPWSVNNFITLF